MAYVEFLRGLKLIFPQANAPGRMEPRLFSPFDRKQDFEELRHEVFDEK